MQETFLWL